MKMKKILICAVPFSDNLGDGVIAASLAHIADMKYPGVKVEFLDIAGRVAFDEANLRGGGWANSVYTPAAAWLLVWNRATSV